MESQAWRAVGNWWMFVGWGNEEASDESMGVSIWQCVDTLHPANPPSPGAAEEGNNKRKLRTPMYQGKTRFPLQKWKYLRHWMKNNATFEQAPKLPANSNQRFCVWNWGAYLQVSIHFMPHYLAFRWDLIKKAVASFESNFLFSHSICPWQLVWGSATCWGWG